MNNPVLVPLIGFLVLFVLLVLLVTSRYKVAGPNQAFIVTGRKGKAVLNPETGALTAQYNDAAVLQMLIEVLPQIAREVAALISNIKDLTIVSTDGVGALPKQVTDNVVQTLSMLKTSTGLDLESVIKRVVDGAAPEPGAVVAT